MKIKRKVLASILAVSLLGSIPAFATETSEHDKVAEKVLSEVTALYTDYYTISNATAAVVGTTQSDDGSTIVTVFTSFNRTLKAASADELPYVQGLEAALADLTDPDEIATAQAYLDSVKLDMNENYIGTAQSTEADFTVTVPSTLTRASNNAIDISSITYVGMDEDLPAENLAPASPEVLQANGAAAIETVIEATPMIMTRASTDIQKYNRITARDYARKWSCTGGYTSDHSSCHNPSYSFIDSNDCANFVSQAISAGGLPTSGTWTKGTDAWQSCTYLRNYMTNNNFFFQSTNGNKAYAGSIINWVNSKGVSTGHVGLVDQNDTVTMTFCAHTKCRKSCPWAGESVDFYIPRWDSYGGVWAS